MNSKYGTSPTVSNSHFRWVFVLLGNAIMMCMGTVYAWSIFRVAVEAKFQIGATFSGMPYMVSLACYALVMLLTGPMINKRKPITLMVIGGGLIALGWILSSFATNIFLLTITYGVISGAGVGFAYGVPMKVVASWFPDKKGLATGLVLVGFGLSPLVTAPLTKTLIDALGVSNTFLYLGIAFGILIPLFSLPFRYPPEEHNTQAIAQGVPENAMDRRELIKTKPFFTLYSNFLIGSMIGLMMVGLTLKIGVQMVGMSAKAVAVWMSVFAVFNGIGRPIFGWLTDRLSYQKTMRLSFGLILLAAALMLLGNGSALSFCAAFSIFWLNLGGWLAIAPTTTLSQFGARDYSRNYGVVFTAYGIGAVLGVLLSGLLVDMFGGFAGVFYLVIGLSAIGMFNVK